MGKLDRSSRFTWKQPWKGGDFRFPEWAVVVQSKSLRYRQFKFHFKQAAVNFLKRARKAKNFKRGYMYRLGI